jgi:hypothetical protein
MVYFSYVRAPVIDMAELECLFSAVVPTSATKGSADKLGGRSSAPRNEKIHLVYICFKLVQFYVTQVGSSFTGSIV